MIIINTSNVNLGDEIINKELIEDFYRIRDIPQKFVTNPEIIDLVYQIIEYLPINEVFEEFIFSKNKYNILIKHDSLIKAIRIKNTYIIEKVILESNKYEIIKTALHFVTNQEILVRFIQGENNNLSACNFQYILKFALYKFQDDELFYDNAHLIYDNISLYKEFKKIQLKSSYKRLKYTQKRLIPYIIGQLDKHEIKKEFSKFNKYPEKIIDLVS